MQRHIAAAEASSAVIPGSIYRMQRHIAAAVASSTVIAGMIYRMRRHIAAAVASSAVIAASSAGLPPRSWFCLPVSLPYC